MGTYTAYHNKRCNLLGIGVMAHCYPKLLKLLPIWADSSFAEANKNKIFLLIKCISGCEGGTDHFVIIVLWYWSHDIKIISSVQNKPSPDSDLEETDE